MSVPSDPRRVVLIAYPGVQALDVVGPADVFAAACEIRPDAYRVEILAPTSGSIRTSSGLTIAPDASVFDYRGAIDTLLVPGGAGSRLVERDQRLVGWLREAAPWARRVVSVCTGAFLLARAGLLDGRTATTHWAYCRTLAERYPDVRVQTDPIFVRDGATWTSAGVTAGMDMVLALVEADLGREVSLEVARRLVLFVQRPGGQSQFSSHLTAQLAERSSLRAIQCWIADNLAADLRVDALAVRAAMSPRSFARAFRREVGVTPAAYVERARVEAARRALADGEGTIETIASRYGFGTAETMRRAFHRRLGTSPAEYRARFRPALERAA